MNSIIQEGIQKGLISISEDEKTIKYIHQNKSRNYTNPEEKVQAEAFILLIIKHNYKPERIKMFVPVKMGVETKEADIVVYNDYVQPNIAVDTGELDANFFQHYPYLESFNEERGTKVVSAGVTHYEPFGIYAGKVSSLADLKDGAKIAVPNDVTNEARALQLLAAQGLIKIKDGAGLTATKNDIVENPKNIELLEVEAAQVPRSLKDVDVAVINGNYAIEAGLKVKDALAVEDASSEAANTYANIIAVKEGNEKSEAILALLDAIQSPEVKKFIEDKYEGAVVPLF